MDEYGISFDFLNRLIPTLYDLRVYEKEKVASPDHHSGSLATSSTSGSTDSSSASTPSHPSLVLDKDVSKIVTVTCANVTGPQTSIKDKMSQTSENNIENFEVCSLVGENQEEASISGGMLVLQVTGPANPGSANPVPIVQGVGAANPVSSPPDPNEATRAEAAYQCIIASLPTFVKKSTPHYITDDQLDGFTTYFSIPYDKLDTHIPFPGEQLFRFCIEEGSSDPDLPLAILRYMSRPFLMACDCHSLLLSIIY
ncbi:hypothetical protein LIER_34133 [Lithospermum erythrorhizon]|uniref:Uncharacterized protein n=1 Tax=Lithospermum erythrorhizon TaxID=34254 RepID=A0AAV3S1V5_LITER